MNHIMVFARDTEHVLLMKFHCLQQTHGIAYRSFCVTQLVFVRTDRNTESGAANMEGAAPLLVRSSFMLLSLTLTLQCNTAESGSNNFIHPLFIIIHDAKFLEDMSLQSASLKGRIVQ